MIKRILGTETEFGIVTHNPEALDPVSTSLLLINNYPNLPSTRVLWDYEHENPLLDARGFEIEGERERPGPDYNRLLNKVLANGGRLYVDGAHPEYSTPECTNPRDVLIYEKAGDRILSQCCEHASRVKEQDKIVLYRNNTDGKGNSYGYHENYLVDRAVPFESLMKHLIPFFVTRQIYAGSGKVGAENRMPPVPYQISQRADFFETVVDLNTMVKRPIINTRDEPHCDAVKYRRLHVIVGDANMAEYSTYIKLGATAVILTLVEENWPLPELELEDPVRSIKEVSRDIHLKAPIRLSDGRKFTAIEIQRLYVEAARRYFEKHELDPTTRDVLQKWEEVLDRLEEDPMQLSRQIDWVIKLKLIQSYMERKKCGWGDSRLAMMDLQYHDIRPEKGLYAALEKDQFVDRITTDREIEQAEQNPPTDTRAYFRGSCLKKFPKEVYAASWSSILFDVGNTTIKKVPLMEPLRGTESLTRSLLESAQSIEEVLGRLSM
ncbi:MAG TPA: depupylase/deamidase Dop [Nitrospiria bacterium]|jgi:proteasome accessory factor A|nr:depupylase/deamidase Dop [Nitrospiria bacterium]